MKTTKLLVRSLSMILCLVMLASMLIACDNNTGNEGQTSDTQPTTSDTTAPAGTTETTGPNDVEELPEMNYGGKEFKMLLRKGDHLKDMYVETIDVMKSSALDMVVYTRNKTIEAKYGVKIVADQSSDGNLDTDQINPIKAGEANYHVIANHGRGMFTYAVQSTLMNWEDLKYVDTNKDYWNQGMKKDFTVNGVLFCFAGDLSYQSLGATVGMIFNKTVCANIGEEYPYELVLDDEWTFEKFEEMVKKAGSGTGEQLDPANGDLMGYMTTQFRGPLNVLYASGGSVVTLNDERTALELSLYSARNANVYEDYFNLLDLPNCKNMDGYDMNDAKIFANGNVLFFDTRIGDISDLIVNGMDNYGVVPWPKYDEDVDGYYSWCDAVGNTFGLPVTLNTEEADFAGFVLEALCAEGYREVIPLYYEEILQSQYVDASGVKMMDIIREGRVYDIASYMYWNELGGNCGYELISFPDHNFTTWWAGKESMAKEKLVAANTLFKMITR